MAEARLTRRVRFSAAHRYHRPEWSDAENRRRFGACANPHGHGHNYILDVTVAGTIDEVTGFCVDLAELDAMLRRVVLQPLDHQHLNHVVPEFAPGRAIPSTENLARYLWPRIAAAMPHDARLLRLRLHEDDSLYVDFVGGIAVMNTDAGAQSDTFATGADVTAEVAESRNEADGVADAK